MQQPYTRAAVKPVNGRDGEAAFPDPSVAPETAPMLALRAADVKKPPGQGGHCWNSVSQQLDAAGVFSTASPNSGRRRTPRALPANAAGSHSQACRLPDRMPLK